MINFAIDLISKPWVGSLLGIIGLAAAIFIYFKSKRKTILAYQYDRITIVGGSNASFPSELQISFSGKPVPQVTSSRFFIWNAGNTTIRGSQIVEADPFRVSANSDAVILKTSILRFSRKVNDCIITQDISNPHKAIISFDFLDPEDGATIEILHTGNQNSLTVHGTLRGIPKGAANYGRSNWNTNRSFRKFAFSRLPLYFAVIFGLGITSYGIFRPQIDQLDAIKESKAAANGPNRWPIIFVGIFYAGMPAILLWMRRRRYPNSLDLEDKPSS